MYDKANWNDPAIVAAIETVAKARGVSMAQIAVARLLQKPGVAVSIVAASKLAYIEEAVAAFALALTSAEVAPSETPCQSIRPARF